MQQIAAGSVGPPAWVTSSLRVMVARDSRMAREDLGKRFMYKLGVATMLTTIVRGTATSRRILAGVVAHSAYEGSLCYGADFTWITLPKLNSQGVIVAKAINGQCRTLRHCRDNLNGPCGSTLSLNQRVAIISAMLRETTAFLMPSLRTNVGILTDTRGRPTQTQSRARARWQNCSSREKFNQPSSRSGRRQSRQVLRASAP
jgi:hypothetical protein